MKILRKVFVAFAILGFLSFTLALAAHLYTKDKTIKLAEEIAGDLSWELGYYRGPIKPISPIYLGSVLLSNIHANGSDGGMYTSDAYVSGFKDVLAANPDLAYKAWDLYKDDFINAFEEKIEKTVEEKITKLKEFGFKTDTSSYMRNYVYMPNKKTGKSEKITFKEKRRIYTYYHYTKKGDYKLEYDGYNRHYYYPIGAKLAQLKKFSLSDYWEKEKEIIKQYQKLMDALLELSDSELNEYMAEIKEEHSTYSNDFEKDKCKQWLITKKLLPKEPAEGYDWRGDPIKDGAWNFWVYPIDFLFLTVRVQDSYPEQWPYKKFIKEARKFSDYVLKDLP